MSKAFTKEDNDAGFAPPASTLAGIPSGHFRITTTGERLASAHADARIREAVTRAEVLPRVVDPERALLGVTVVVAVPPKAGAEGERRSYRLVSAEERALLGEGCSVDGPIGRALLGARLGDVREVALPPPRGVEELEVVALDGE